MKETSLYTSPQGGKPIQQIIPSPDAKHFAAMCGDVVMIDGKEIAGYKCGKWPVFSPDSKHWAFPAESATAAGTYFIVMDGTEKKIDGPAEQLAFSPDSKRLAYVMKLNNKACFVVDDAKGPFYDEVIALSKEYNASARIPGSVTFFSPDSRRVAYIARNAASIIVVRDGKEGKAYERVELGAGQQPHFTADSAHLVYTVTGGITVVDDEEKEKGMILSPDAAHTMTSNGHCVTVDGKKGKEYRWVSKPAFSPDSRHYAYAASVDDDPVLVVDTVEKKIEGYSNTDLEFYTCTVMFTPDSLRTVMLVRNAVIADAVPQKMEDTILSLLLSPDSKHLAILTQGPRVQTLQGHGLPGMVRVQRDFLQGAEYNSVGCMPSLINRNPVAFTPDSKYVLYFATTGAAGSESWFLVVDATETPLKVAPYSRPVFDTARKLRFIALKDGKEIVSIEVEIKD
jgi:WD40 repeat protein